MAIGIAMIWGRMNGVLHTSRYAGVMPSPPRSDTPITHPPVQRRASPGERLRRRWTLAVLGVLLLLGIAAALRQPLADRFWPEPRIQQLLDEGGKALREGRLEAADGSGAREKFEAAQALDSDRGEARAGLLQVGAAALQQARLALRDNRYDDARRLVGMARELQVPRDQVESVMQALRQREAEHAGLDGLLAQADAASGAGRWDEALPLYQRILELQPESTRALEGREDALADLLEAAGKDLVNGDLDSAADRIARVRGYDAGHVDLPAAQALLTQALEQRRQRADRQLRRQRLEQAEADYRQVLRILANDTHARQGLENVGIAYAVRARRSADDFRFEQAEDELRRARELTPQSTLLANAERDLVRARQARAGQVSSLAPAERQRRVRRLLAQADAAEARGDWLTPPGESAYDHLRAAQALAAEDKAVRQAAARMLPRAKACFEDELRANRVRAAQGCYDAWRTLASGDQGLAEARRQLAQRWIALGDERLRAGDIGYAKQAMRAAEALDPNLPGLAEFGARVRSAGGGPEE